MKLNKRQKKIVYDLVSVVVVTVIVVIAMFNFKDYVNRSEAMRAMTHLGQICLDYRSENNQVPSTYYVDSIKKQLEGGVRAGEIIYRGRWITFGASDDEILAYTKKGYGRFFLGSGYIVLRLDGTVEWMKPQQFKELLASRQSTEEKRFTEQNP
ncbi:MAG: hypothetical protein JW804_03455 [Sedimentisphaerales bacterium]|nr:hypothetical protein [Sedimentisphaerales bacterium]